MSTTTPSLADYRTCVEGRLYLLVLDILDLPESAAVAADLEGWITAFAPTAAGDVRYWLDWFGWAQDYLEEGRGWSAGEDRIARIVLSLLGIQAAPSFFIADLDQVNPSILALLVSWASRGAPHLTAA